ncbi:ATP-binding protein [Spirulina sp. CCNP1310]|uniref:sensor histidine kinase n=1 Tax=Spirulina sp. CCNP1310 TaxID=3110249 RepID=UPI002B2113DE|nr:ATP-binding protein [Spirulina sp. CCNP1310]MEA5421525.1 ATP-binding protein [Spirulina sp. CCNP1310]
MQVLVIGEGVTIKPFLQLLRSCGHAVTCETTIYLPPPPPFYPLIFIQGQAANSAFAAACHHLRQTHTYTTLIALLPALNSTELQTLLNVGLDDYILQSTPLIEQKLRLKIIEQQSQRRPLSLPRPQPQGGLKTTALSQFPYLASHHLRQTLIQIRNQLNDLLTKPRETPLEPSTANYLNQVIERATIMQQMLGDILLDTQSHLQNPLMMPPITHQDYLILNEYLVIQEFSDGVQRYAEVNTAIIQGQDVRDSFPELSGLEDILKAILRNEHRGYEISGIARFSDSDFPLYFDLYVSAYPNHILNYNPPHLIVLLNNATERMIFQQRLIQSANEAQLLLKKLATTKNYITQIINSMADALIVTTKSGIIKKINAAAERLFGYSELALMNQPIGKLVEDQTFLTHISEGKVIFQAEVICRRRNGDIVYVSFSCGVIETEEDTQDFVCVGRDVTERKKAEAQIQKLNVSLQQRTVELEAVNEELESFSRTVSHDLRTPISHIEFFNQMLADEYGQYLDEEGQDYLAQIRNACRRMKQLIHDLLQLSRATRADLTLGPVNLSQIALEVIDELQANAPERRGEFLVAADLETVGHESLLRIVLENLLGNAWKYTSKRSLACIELGRCEDAQIYQKYDLNDDMPLFFLRDNGAGFDMSYADRLFKTFERLHSQSEFEGTGIGLTTVQRIIRRHGGEIWAEGQVGEGAVFYFTINPQVLAPLAAYAAVD